MTEDEAKTKWCPFSRYLSEGAGVNRWKQSAPPEEPHALNPVPCRCIGSDCMAWRIDDSYLQMDMDDKGILFRPVYGEVHGSCGLAEKP